MALGSSPTTESKNKDKEDFREHWYGRNCRWADQKKVSYVIAWERTLGFLPSNQIWFSFDLKLKVGKKWEKLLVINKVPWFTKAEWNG